MFDIMLLAVGNELPVEFPTKELEVVIENVLVGTSIDTEVLKILLLAIVDVSVGELESVAENELFE